MSVIPSVAVDLCGRLRPSFHPAACSACSPSMSWERKLLHCGPRADRRDLLAHYLFISVLHRWLPRGSDCGVSLHRLLVGTGVLDTAGRWTDACYWKDNLAAYRSLLLSGDSMRPVNIFFFMCDSYLWTCLSLTMSLQKVPQMLLLLYLSIFPCMVVQADHLNGLKGYSIFFYWYSSGS